MVRRGTDLLLVRRRGARGEGAWPTPGGNLELHHVTRWFEAERADGDAHVRASDEISELAWFDEQSLPEPLFRPFRSLLEGRAQR